MSKSTKQVNTELLAGAREARNILFHLMLAEQAQKVRGTYTEAYDKIDKVIRAAEEKMKEISSDA